MAIFGDADYIRTRFMANQPVNGELEGSNFVANWRSVGIFGPLTIRPDLWDKGIAKQVLKSTMDYFER